MEKPGVFLSALFRRDTEEQFQEFPVVEDHAILNDHIQFGHGVRRPVAASLLPVKEIHGIIPRVPRRFQVFKPFRGCAKTVGQSWITELKRYILRCKRRTMSREETSADFTARATQVGCSGKSPGIDMIRRSRSGRFGPGYALKPLGDDFLRDFPGIAQDSKAPCEGSQQPGGGMVRSG